MWREAAAMAICGHYCARGQAITLPHITAVPRTCADCWDLGISPRIAMNLPDDRGHLLTEQSDGSTPLHEFSVAQLVSHIQAVDAQITAAMAPLSPDC